MRRLLLHSGSPCCTQRPDWIVRDDGGQLKFKQRVVTYDTHRIETLMVIPI